MEREGRGREVRKLGAASFLLDISSEGGSGGNVRNSSKHSTRDFPPRFLESSSSLHQSVDHRSRVNRVHKRGTAREGHPIGPALGPLGIDPGRIGGGITSRGGAGNRGGDGVIFAESPMAPGIPVVYRTPEQRISNPDRLNLDRRHLTMCPILEGEEQLRLLNLQHNAITRLQHLGSLRRLVFLDLYDNLITDIIGLEGLYSLRVLMLGRNRIHCISGLQTLTRLDVLDLHGNMIREVANLDHLSHLRVLNLAGNDITVLEGVSSLHSLSELNLRRNRISRCRVSDIPSLQRLYLSHNQIHSVDDIACLATSPAIIDMSIDGNPLSDSPGHRAAILSHFNQLAVLNQTPVTDRERTEALIAAESEERLSKETAKKSLIMEERLVALATIKEEWNDPDNEENSCYYIDRDNKRSVTLYGAMSITNLMSSIDMVTIATLGVHYIEISHLCVSLLIPLKEKLANLNSLVLGDVKMESLLQLQQLAMSLPPSVTSLQVGGANTVTRHALYKEWAWHVLNPRVQLKNTQEEHGKGEEEERGSGRVFESLGRLHAMCDSHLNNCHVNNNVIKDSAHQLVARSFANDVWAVTANNYRKEQLFEEVWPDLIGRFIDETLDWTRNALENNQLDDYS